MNLYQVMQSVAPILESRIAAAGPEEALREAARDMASSGALGFLKKIMDIAGSRYSAIILSDVPEREITMARGSILALRGVWQDIIQLGADPADAPPLPYEQDEFSTMADVDS